VSSRLKLLLALFLLTLLAACSSVTGAAPAQISGPYDLALVGDLLFITSANSSELRVLNIAAVPRDFVRAPNPIEPLSVPVLDRPTALARDEHFVDGKPVAGPYLYARGDGSAEISVVGAGAGNQDVVNDPNQLKEAFRLIAPAPVTAIAAQGPATLGTDPSTLYYATWDGVTGTLWKVELPPTIDGFASFSPAPTAVVSTPSEVIRSLALLPDGQSIALATRDGGGNSGRTEVLRFSDFSTTPLAFPFPVRKLEVNPAFDRCINNPDPTQECPAANVLRVAEGTRVYGVLDEETCGGNPQCEGILSVDVSTGQVSLDWSGNPMVPLTFGRGLIQDFTLQPNGRLATPIIKSDGTTGIVTARDPLLGVVTTSGDTNSFGGSIYLFDADGLRQIDTNASNAAVSALTFVPADTKIATTASPGDGPTSIALAEGATPDENISVTYEGTLTGFLQLPSSDADGQRFPAPGSPFLAEVQPNDLIRLGIRATDGTIAYCPTLLHVATVEADAVTTTDPIPAGCTNRTDFTLLSGGTQPWVVVGSVRGFLGRTAPNSGFNFTSCASPAPYCTAHYYFHPQQFDPATATSALQFQMGPGPAAPSEGDSYVITVASNFVSLFFTLDSTVFPGWYLPQPVVYYQRSDLSLDRLYVGYPSSQGVLEADPGAIVPDSANASNLVGYR
jgi:hypothetical protein